jgi:hypothetical protein
LCRPGIALRHQSLKSRTVEACWRHQAVGQRVMTLTLEKTDPLRASWLDLYALLGLNLSVLGVKRLLHGISPLHKGTAAHSNELAIGLRVFASSLTSHTQSNPCTDEGHAYPRIPGNELAFCKPFTEHSEQKCERVGDRYGQGEFCRSYIRRR